MFPQKVSNVDTRAGWDETNFLGEDRDREIILMKINYETENEKKWMLIFLTRRDRDEIV